MVLGSSATGGGRIAAAVLCVVASVVATAGGRAIMASDGPPEVRALWVTRASLASPDAVATLVEGANASGFNTLLVQVRGRGDAYYTSRLEPRAQVLSTQPAHFDPLARVVTLARAEGLAVHAWLNVNLVASAQELPKDRTHLVHRHPEWLMVPRELAHELNRVSPRSPEYVGRLARWTRTRSDDVEGLYASPLVAAAADHVVGVVDDLVSRYDLDGVHLDYARFPSPEFDHGRRALEAFRDELARGTLTPADRRRLQDDTAGGLLALTDVYPERWTSFRQSRLNALVMRIRTAVKARRPGATVSAAVYPDPADAAASRLQDWRTWIDSGLIDAVCPMAYTPDSSLFAAQIATVRQLAGARLVWAGIGAYRLSPGQTVENIRTARRLGADGIVLFSYDSLVRPEAGAPQLSSVGRAAFAP